MIVGFKDVFRVAAKLSFAGADMLEHRLAIETPRILVMEPVRHVSEGKDAVATFKRHRGDPFEIDGGRLFCVPEDSGSSVRANAASTSNATP